MKTTRLTKEEWDKLSVGCYLGDSWTEFHRADESHLRDYLINIVKTAFAYGVASGEANTKNKIKEALGIPTPQ